MDKLITDNPRNHLEYAANMVYNKDNWQCIRHTRDGMQTVDFCLMLCESRGCQVPTSAKRSSEAKDEWLCGCDPYTCPIAAVYAALSGLGHVRDRLKMYEDAEMMPPENGKAGMYKKSSNVEFDVLYADGTKHHAAEGILFEVHSNNTMTTHIGSSQLAVLFTVVEAVLDTVQQLGVQDAFLRHIKATLGGIDDE